MERGAPGFRRSGVHAGRGGDGTALAALALEARAPAGPGWPILVAGGLQRAAAAAQAPAGVADLPRAAQEMLYPLVWPQLVGAEAQDRGSIPGCCWPWCARRAPTTRRPAPACGARGLTQVIPGTATGIAAALQMPDFQQAQLYRPAVSLRFGAYYLHDTLTSFDRNILYALAGYNAGPGNVPAGPAGGSTTTPTSLSTISTTGRPAQYVQIVYNNYAIYRWLYGQH